MFAKLVRIVVLFVLLVGCTPTQIRPIVTPTDDSTVDTEIGSVEELVEVFNGHEIKIEIIEAGDEVTRAAWKIYSDGLVYSYMPWGNSDYDEAYIDVWVDGYRKSTGLMTDGAVVEGVLYAWKNGQMYVSKYGDKYGQPAFYYYDIVIATATMANVWEEAERLFLNSYMDNVGVDAFDPGSAPGWMYYSPKAKLEFMCQFDTRNIYSIARHCPVYESESPYGDWLTPSTAVSYGYADEVGVVVKNQIIGDIKILAARPFVGEIMNNGFPWDYYSNEYMEVEFEIDGSRRLIVVPVGAMIATHDEDSKYVGWNVTDQKFGEFTIEPYQRYCVGGCG